MHYLFIIQKIQYHKGQTQSRSSAFLRSAFCFMLKSLHSNFSLFSKLPLKQRQTENMPSTNSPHGTCNVPVRRTSRGRPRDVYCWNVRRPADVSWGPHGTGTSLISFGPSPARPADVRKGRLPVPRGPVTDVLRTSSCPLGGSNQ